MTDVRASGFMNKRQLQEHLEDLAEDDQHLEGESEFVEERHKAQVEIAWLRREIDALTESVSAANGKQNVASAGRRRSQQGWRTAAFAVGGVIAAMILWRARRSDR